MRRKSDATGSKSARIRRHSCSMRTSARSEALSRLLTSRTTSRRPSQSTAMLLESESMAVRPMARNSAQRASWSRKAWRTGNAEAAPRPARDILFPEAIGLFHSRPPCFASVGPWHSLEGVDRCRCSGMDLAQLFSIVHAIGSGFKVSAESEKVRRN